MNTFVHFWAQLVGQWGELGAALALIYAIVLAASVVSVAITTGRGLRQWIRHRRVARELEAVKRAAYREHRGQHVA